MTQVLGVLAGLVGIALILGLFFMFPRGRGEFIALVAGLLVLVALLGINLLAARARSRQPADPSANELPATAAETAPSTTLTANTVLTPSALAHVTPATTARPLQTTALPAASPTITPTITSLAPTTSTTQVPTTPAASATALSLPSGAFVLDHFDGPSSGWPDGDQGTWSAGYESGRYQLTLHGQPNARVSTMFAADNYRLSADVVVEHGAGGLIFGSLSPTIVFCLVITPDGSFALQEQRQERDPPLNLIGWASSDALRRGVNAHNQLRIERSGVLLNFYANDRLLAYWKIQSSQFNNLYGFALSSPDGTGHATFDDLTGTKL